MSVGRLTGSGAMSATATGCTKSCCEDNAGLAIYQVTCAQQCHHDISRVVSTDKCAVAKDQFLHE